MFDTLMGIASGSSGLLMGGGTAGIILFVLKKIKIVYVEIQSIQRQYHTLTSLQLVEKT